MKNDIPQIKFNNTRKESQFDLIFLKDLLSKKQLHNELFNSQQIKFYVLLFFTDGNAHHTIDFEKYQCKKGTLLSIRKNQIHKFHPSNAEGFLILFTDDFLIQSVEKNEVSKSLQLFNELITSPKTQLDNTNYLELKELIESINKEYITINDNYSSSIIRSLLTVLFKKILRLKQQQNAIFNEKKYLSQFIAFQTLVEEHCFKTKTVSDYANQLNVSTKTLNNITQEIINESAKKFIDQILVTQIKRLLINTKLSVKEIAYQSGFDEPTNLYKFFKKYSNVTPENFRNQNS